MTFNTNMDMVLNTYWAINREEVFLPFSYCGSNQTTGKFHKALDTIILMV